MQRLEKLLLWVDPVIRRGPETMAVDEWLMGMAVEPVLRVYRWEGDWASVGYFGKIEEARAAISGVEWVRRWTGGGVVDHRSDWTYSLVVPQGEPLAQMRGGESYRLIHRLLQNALLREGVETRLSGGEQETGSALCFANPVGHDLVSLSGVKLAGAGQRRTRLGLLHQGSVALPVDPAESLLRAQNLAAELAISWLRTEYSPDPNALLKLGETKYQQASWLDKR